MAIKEYDLAFEGTTIHCYEGGMGYPLLMIHGSGPGTASASNWTHVMRPLSRHYHIVAMDLIGFGLSGRKPKEPYFDTGLWSRQAQFVLDRLARHGSVGLIGHSLGGYLVLRLSANNARVDNVLAQGSLGARFRLNKAVDLSWTFPSGEADFRALYEHITKSASVMSDGFVKSRLEVINRDGYGVYFSKMFKGDKQRYLDKTVLTPAELKRLKARVTLLHGAQDRAVPFKQAALPLADSIPQADLIRIANCGHGPSLDHPKKFLDAARTLFG